MQRSAQAALALLAAMTASCQTDQSLQPTPAGRGDPPSGRTMLADSDVSREVRRVLDTEPLLADATIEIDAIGGVVRLRGMIRHPAQRARALALAGQVHGVRRIDDGLIRYGRSGVGDGPLAQTQIQL